MGYVLPNAFLSFGFPSNVIILVRFKKLFCIPIWIIWTLKY